MRLLTRLVGGLPREAPAVVVRHSGLGSIVQLLEAAGEVSSTSAPEGGGGGGGVTAAAAEAAAGGALEVNREAAAAIVTQKGCACPVALCAAVSLLEIKFIWLLVLGRSRRLLRYAACFDIRSCYCCHRVDQNPLKRLLLGNMCCSTREVFVHTCHRPEVTDVDTVL